MGAVPSFILTLQAEEARLEAELKREPLYRRLEAVREALLRLKSAYDASSVATTPTVADMVIEPPPGQVVIVRERSERPGSMASLVTSTAMKLFRETGKRAKSSEIVEVLRKNGTEFSGQKPQAQVASILSHYPLFDNTGDSHGAGYGLREWSELQRAQHGDVESGTAAPTQETAAS